MSVTRTSTGPSAASCRPPAAGIDPTLDADRLAAVAKALSEPLRIELLDVLRRHGQPVCQCELVPLFDVPQSTMSHHINKLAQVGLVNVERRHKWAFYSINPDASKELRTWLA